MKYCFVLVFLYCLQPFPLNAQQVWYVNQQASGSLQNGLSWQTAFPDLQQALASAQYGDAIWVAKGTYLPANDANQYKSFQLISGVRLLGGFIGTEVSESARNPNLNETVLSGDIGQMGVESDNSYHVLIGEGLDGNTRLDGFSIKNGNCEDPIESFPYNNVGAGMLLLGKPGVANAQPLISNCRFTDNKAYEGGGAIAIDWINSNFSGQDTNLINPVFRDCIFENNRAVNYGGAIYKKGPTLQLDTLRWQNCKFINNWASRGWGGGVAILEPRSSNYQFINCLFERDSSWEGGGIYYSVRYEDSVSTNLSIDSCVFLQNKALNGAGFSYLDYGMSVHADLNFKITNSVFEANRSRTSDGAAFYIFGANSTQMTGLVHNCRFLNNQEAGDRNVQIIVSNGSELNTVISNCTFLNNISIFGPSTFNFPISVGAGYGMAPSIANSRIYNCVFANNGGGIAVTSNKESWTNTEVFNCTFYNNKKYILVKQWDPIFQDPGNIYFNKMRVRNCIFQEPGASATLFYSNTPQSLNYYDFDIDYNLINFQFTQLGLYNGIADAFGQHNLFGTIPAFEDANNEDFHLKKCTPGVNQGTNEPAQSFGILTDLDGLPRIAFELTDIGAYESQDSCAVGTYSPGMVKRFLVGPNPSWGALRFEMPGNIQSGVMLRVFSANGSIVHQTTLNFEKEVNLNLDWLDSGIYMLELSDGEETFVSKWMKM
jgi:predicted outer membrane repeat protein